MWQVTGLVNKGSLKSPQLERKSVRFQAQDHRVALGLAEFRLHALGNKLASVQIESVVRIYPRPQPLD